MRLHRLDSAHLQLVSKHSDLSLVVLLHLQLVLFELVDLVTDEFHLLDLLCDLALDLFRGAALIVELGSEGVQDLIEAMIWLTWSRWPQVGIAAMLSSVEHVEAKIRVWKKISRTTYVLDELERSSRRGKAHIPP